MEASRDQWMRRAGPFFPLVLAFRGHSDLPVASEVTPTPEELEDFPSYLVLIGILHGLALALVALVLLHSSLVPAIAASLLIAAHVFITGARAERGVLSAVLPRVGSSDIGSGHILAIVLLRIAVLAGMTPDVWPSALMAMVVAPKVVQLLVAPTSLHFFSSTRHSDGEAPSLRPVLLLFCLLAVLVVSIGWWGLAVFAVAALGGLAARGRQLSGPATSGLGELLVLLLLAWVAPAVVSPFVLAS